MPLKLSVCRTSYASRSLQLDAVIFEMENNPTPARMRVLRVKKILLEMFIPPFPYGDIPKRDILHAEFVA